MSLGGIEMRQYSGTARYHDQPVLGPSHRKVAPRQYNTYQGVNEALATQSHHRLTSNVVSTYGTVNYPERLHSTAESRRLTSTGQDGTNLSDTTGIIYCPEDASMDLTIVGLVDIPYPATIPRFQGQITVTESLLQTYKTWDTHLLEAGSLEQEFEDNQKEGSLSRTARNQQSFESASGDILANALVIDDDTAPRQSAG